MTDYYQKLGRILGTTGNKIVGVDAQMKEISGKEGVVEETGQAADAAVNQVLADLGLTRESSAESVYDALAAKLLAIDQKLFSFLGKPDLSKMSDDSGKLAQLALQTFTPPKGFFIKKEKVAALLEKMPPQSLLDHFGYGSVSELLAKEGFASVVAALRFTQTTQWMHQFFDVAYNDLTAADFEDREVEIKVLHTKWLDIAQKFIGKKFHNVSHLKEYGIIFISPEDISTPGETLRTFLLLMHYLHEVPFYSNLFRKYIRDADFVSKLQSLLRGDVPAGAAPSAPHLAWRIVQRYLAKDDPLDPRLAEHHVDPEAEHWRLVQSEFPKIAALMGDTDKFNISYWTGLDWIGDYFKNQASQDVLVSFDIVDLVMSAVKKGEVKYLYHQQEALWNALFAAYMSRDRLNTLTEENIITGFILL
ncbi:MAG TPA: hypothetical protein VG866_01220 [Candidatus Paceibacterota bacterium]|nr:hypothetical protein [Candidatus Paceibacterota bacterium]